MLSHTCCSPSPRRTARTISTMSLARPSTKPTAWRKTSHRHTNTERVLHRVRSRIERKMTRDTSRVLEQIPMFGDIQSGSKSREKLVKGLTSSLGLMIGKLNASSGFVAIQRAGGGALEVATADGLDRADAKAILRLVQPGGHRVRRRLR